MQTIKQTRWGYIIFKDYIFTKKFEFVGARKFLQRLIFYRYMSQFLPINDKQLKGNALVFMCVFECMEYSAVLFAWACGWVKTRKKEAEQPLSDDRHQRQTERQIIRTRADEADMWKGTKNTYARSNVENKRAGKGDVKIERSKTLEKISS